MVCKLFRLSLLAEGEVISPSHFGDCGRVKAPSVQGIRADGTAAYPEQSDGLPFAISDISQ